MMHQPFSPGRTHCLLLLLLLLVAALTEQGFAYPAQWITAAATSTTRINGVAQQQCHQSHVGDRCARGSDGSSDDVPAGADTLLRQVQTQATVWSDTADVDIVERLRRSLGIVDVTANPSIVSAAARVNVGAGESDIMVQVCLVISLIPDVPMVHVL